MQIILYDVGINLSLCCLFVVFWAIIRSLICHCFLNGAASWLRNSEHSSVPAYLGAGDHFGSRQFAWIADITTTDQKAMITLLSGAPYSPEYVFSNLLNSEVHKFNNAYAAFRNVNASKYVMGCLQLCKTMSMQLKCLSTYGYRRKTIHKGILLKI